MRILEQMRDVTGLAQVTCPWRALLDPYVQVVVRAHRWWKRGALESKWPRPPAALIDGIEVYDIALASVKAFDAEREREERERRRPSR